MAEDNSSKLKFTACPACRGEALVLDDKKNLRPCPQCGQKGLFAVFEGDYLDWTRPLSVAKVFQDWIQRFLSGVINTFLIIFLGVGILLWLWEIFKVSREKFTWQVFWAYHSPAVLLFWLAVLGGLYLFYRLTRAETSQYKIKRRSWREKERSEIEETDFKEALASQNKIDIVPYFNADALKAIEQAWLWARRLKHLQAKPVHLLPFLLRQAEVQLVLARLGWSAKDLAERITDYLRPQAGSVKSPLAFSQDFKKTLFLAYEESFKTGQKKVSPTEILIALTTLVGPAQKFLYDLEIETEDLINVVTWVNIQKTLRSRHKKFKSKARGKPRGVMNRAMTAVATPFLDMFCEDLTFLAKVGGLRLSVGREKEIDEVFRVIEGGSNNVILVGEQGVGKETIIDGIAERMVAEDVPQLLQDKRLVSLNIGALVSKVQAPGDIEGRLVRIIREIARADNIVLFIGNIQNMVGVSTTGGESLDISDILAEALNKKQFIALASTTPADYKKFIETHDTLAGAFQKYDVNEATEEQSIKVLESKAGLIEYKYQVFLSYQAIAEAVKLSKRYIFDQFLPDKAIILLEEVATYVKNTVGKRNLVTAKHVDEVIAKKSNVPVVKVTAKESVKLLKLEEEIHKRIIDQAEAVKMVAEAIRRARAELRDDKRPIVNLLFIGTTGVGKTELAKAVAEVYFGSEESMVRLDMSEYQEASSISRLIGAAPGYGDISRGGYLTESIRKNPFTILLLDEIEKAHPDILNLFLQVMDDGRLMDNKGRVINFSDVILIGTSNAGTQQIQDGMKAGLTMEQIRQKLFDEVLKQYFRPEFLNRFDGIVVFKPLAMPEVIAIARLMLKKVVQRLEVKGIKLEITEEAIKELAQAGFDPKFGARPLRRVIQDRVDNNLAKYLLGGELRRGDRAVLEPKGVIRVVENKES